MTGRTSVWNLGFRPFFLLSAFFAIISILIWIVAFTGVFRPVGFFDPILWHAHEMVYGYTSAVIAGFVLTAAQNWTGRPGVQGTKLKILVLLWVAGRVLMSTFSHPNVFAVAVDLSFFPVLALLLFPYLKPADMKIERVFFAYFALLFSGNLLMHLDSLGWVPGFGLRGALLGLYAIVLMILFMGGRVIPFFTESELARSQPRTWPWVENLSHASAWVFVLSQTFFPTSMLTVIVAFSTALIHLVRLVGWHVRRIRRIAILWVLHLAYLWIILGFALFGFVSLGVLALGPAVHAFAIGGIGAMTYGMMSRVTLGHTGRKIYSTRIIIVGYILLNLAAFVRVFFPVVAAARLGLWVEVSGAFWIMGFVIFAWVYSPMLTRPRVDGRAG